MVERIRAHVALNEFETVTVIDRPAHLYEHEIPFTILSDPGKSSLYAGETPGAVETLMLPAVKVDTVVAEQGWTRLDAIKMDIEGHDCYGLLSARETLARFRPFIVFEYWYITVPEVAEQAFRLLADLGYSLQGLRPDGVEVPFDWQAPPVTQAGDQIDVLAYPG
jgi:FkbM family methyltransferase